MNIELFLLSLIFIIIGIIIMVKHKFYRFNSSDMLFASKFKIFLSGLLFTLVGLYGFIQEIFKIFKK